MWECHQPGTGPSVVVTPCPTFSEPRQPRLHPPADVTKPATCCPAATDVLPWPIPSATMSDSNDVSDSDPVRVRVYGDLDMFTGERELTAPFGAPRSVKDLLEALGIPHTELGVIVVDGRPVGFGHLLTGGERIAAYPPFHELPIPPQQSVLPPPIAPRFVLDVHLGTLTRRLRLLGFDCWYRTDTDDAQLARIAADEQRILLTRDRHLLMRRTVVHGYCPRSSDPDEQALEVLRRFHLSERIDPLTRCVPCNGRLLRVDKNDVIDELPPRTRNHVEQVSRCENCGQLFWPGSHLEAIDAFLARAGGVGRTDR